MLNRRAARLAAALASSAHVETPDHHRALVDVITRTVLPDVRWRAVDASPRFRRLLDRRGGGSPGLLKREAAARLCHLEPTAFSRWFEDCAGIRFRDWRRGYRVADALVHLAADPNRNIATAADAAGFETRRGLERACHDILGMSPRAALAGPDARAHD
jgi:AraC-like DNA-binding protein